MEKSQERKNREVIGNMGQLVSSLYDEVDILPLSETAKHALVMVMVSDITRRTGDEVTFKLPAQQKVAAA